MNIGTVGQTNDWQKFIRLAHDARIRNDGLSKASQPGVSLVNKNREPVAMRSTPSFDNRTVQVGKGHYYASTPSPVPAKILGGTIDAWA